MANKCKIYCYFGDSAEEFGFSYAYRTQLLDEPNYQMNKFIHKYFAWHLEYLAIS